MEQTPREVIQFKLRPGFTEADVAEEDRGLLQPAIEVVYQGVLGRNLLRLMKVPEKKNALSIALLKELADILRSLGDNDKIRCIVTAGAGDSYSSGRDLYDMRSGQSHRQRAACPGLGVP